MQPMIVVSVASASTYKETKCVRRPSAVPQQQLAYFDKCCTAAEDGHGRRLCQDRSTKDISQISVRSVAAEIFRLEQMLYRSR